MELQYQFHDYQSVATKYKVLPIAVFITKPLTDCIEYKLQVNIDAIKIKAF